MDALVLASPDAAIAAVPHMLGFCPDASLVLIWCGQGRIVLTQRMDLDDAGGRAWVDEAARHGLTVGADAVIAMAFRARGSHDGLPGRGPMDVLERRLAQAGVELLDALLVDGGRWWSYRCEEACCPAQGRLVDPVVAAEVTAEFVLLGSAPFTSRDALAASLAPSLEGRVAGAPRPPEMALEDWRDDMLRGPVTRLLGSGELDTTTVASVLGGVADVRVRDTTLWFIARHDDPRHVLGRLSVIVRAAEPGWVAPAATMTAIAAWLAGDGARASIALERAMAEDPGYSLALLVDRSLRSAVPPGAWLALMRGLPFAVCRHGQRAGTAPSPIGA